MRRRRIFVNNRGEIAVRIIEACERMGFDTVLGVSIADVDTLAAKRATKVLVLGEARSSDSYLNQEAVVHAAEASGCDAIHPGYGFLSEQSQFARLCAENSLVFIGPKPEQLEILGDKLSARKLASSLGIPSPNEEAASEEATDTGRRSSERTILFG